MDIETATERQGWVNEGIAAERERVRAVLLSDSLGDDIAALMEAGMCADTVVSHIAARLGIDLRQLAGEGEG